MASRNVLASVFRHRDLVVQFTRRELELRHKGSRLGHLWGLIRPLTLLALYLFVFGVIFGGRYGGVSNETTFDFAIALFLSLSLFNVFAEVMSVAPALILNQPNFVKKVVFPLEIMPVSNVATSLYHGLLSALVALAIAVCGHRAPGWPGLAALPLLLIPVALFSLGISWGLSAVGLFVRDVGQLVPFLVQALMYASAVVYPPGRLATMAPRAWLILKYNPLLRLMDEARRVVLWHLPPHPAVWLYVYGTGAIAAAAGYAMFSLLRPYFAEVI